MEQDGTIPDLASWEQEVPAAITGDTLWRLRVYRLSLYVADLGWQDVTALIRDGRTRALADQLYRALGSISANIAEGYSRGTGRDRALFYRYALGSARESRDWYYKARHILPKQRLAYSLDLLGQINRLLLTMISEQQGRFIAEEFTNYDVSN